MNCSNLEEEYKFGGSACKSLLLTLEPFLPQLDTTLDLAAGANDDCIQE
jgi:hypothetical protein